MPSPTIICPKCKAEIPVEEALSHAFREKIETEAKMNFGEEKRLLQEELESKKEKLAAAEGAELKLRKDKLALEEEKRSFEIQKQRAIDEERAKIREQTLNEATDSWRLKEKEFEKKLSDMKLALDDAQRKANQGSQQLQGEVQELDLEESLKGHFVFDSIEPVGKGVRGADIRQIVKTQLGNDCGTILWESKRTKAWSDEWLVKLKDDLRGQKANIPVIISSVMPEGARSGIGLVDGVWVVNYTLYLVLAELLRQKLIEVAREKYVSQNKSTKAEILYNYIVGHEFIQQVEAITEVYQDMQSQIAKERAAFEKIWKTREAQANRIMTGTAAIVGSIRGSVGSTMPAIKGMDLPGLEGGE